MATSQTQDAPASDPAPERSLLRRVVAASMAGTVVEWYDFFLYSTASALVFAKVLLPEMDNVYDGIIAAFVTYAVGFAARPLGGIVFGHIGDRLGRKYTLQLTIMLIGIATVLMGCLPTYNQIGVAAPVLLVLLRFVQGLALGGEWGGAVLLVGEHAPNDRRATWTAWPQAAVPVGNLLATLVLTVMSAVLTEEAFLSWGWRVAFWLSALVVVVGYWIRRSVSEAPIFEAARAEQAEEKHAGYGVVEVLRRYPRAVVTGMGLRFAENIMYYLVVAFSIVYLKEGLGMDTTQVLSLVAIAHVSHFVVILAVGRVMDGVGRKPVYLAGAILGGTWGFWAFPLLDTRDTGLILTAIIVGLVFHAMMYAGQPAIMAEMFPTRTRYSGVSISYQVTSIFAGSLAPILATTWLKTTGHWWPTAVYLLVAGLITAVAVVSLRETKGASLHALDAADAAERTGVAA
ncbi:MFS transporter [Myceligenerans xiligouense]|uniref:Putative MFS family arabinose efflux permease n=1 Tax=Myceligenerans xiligouense TaxID=253184 RepID=A0A3N4ZNP8_9MICO|nr:MFS transporter [Myceligenerans xiligouense]RPF22565.1 putative MFS family arabinose efflux permease [Myceligenerans xiligouense]